MSYDDQSLNRLSCGDTFALIYSIVVLDLVLGFFLRSVHVACGSSSPFHTRMVVIPTRTKLILNPGTFGTLITGCKNSLNVSIRNLTFLPMAPGCHTRNLWYA